MITPVQKRPTRFLQALLWSLGFHLCLLSVLSIRTFFLPLETNSNQVDVQLDTSDEPPLAIHTSMGEGDRALESLLDGYSLKYEPFIETALMPSLQETKPASIPLVRTYTNVGIPWAPEEDLQLKVARIYPLKISLQYGLNQLYLIDDASSLFIPAQDDTLLSSPLFAKEAPKVTFLIHVDTKTGEITKTRCDFPMKDKELQQLACTILKTVRFHPKEANPPSEIHGEITLQFSAFFDDIEPFVRSSKKQGWPL